MSVPSFRAVPVPSQPFVAALAGCWVVVLGCRPAAATVGGGTAGGGTAGDGAVDAGSEPAGAELIPGTGALGTALGVDAAGHLRRARATGSAGEVTTVPLLAAGTERGTVE